MSTPPPPSASRSQGPAISLGGILGGWPDVAARFQEVLGDLEEERREFPRFLRQILNAYHGIDHWARVGVLGLAIAGRLRTLGRVTTACLALPGGIEEAAILSAFFHDCARTSGGAELDHGREGQRVWWSWSARKGLPRDFAAAVSQAILFHVDHIPVDPSANEAAICLANADRLERVRLFDSLRPEFMYEDGAWREIWPHAREVLARLRQDRVLRELGLAAP